VRVELFSDAVFAIAVTLIMVDIKIPDGTYPEDVPDELRKLWPHCFAYFLSFAIVAMQWVDHHDIYHDVGTCKRGLFWMNFLFLCCIAFIPFPTDVLGRFSYVPAAAAFYSAVITFTILAKIILWKYIELSGQLKKPNLSPRVVPSLTRLWYVGLCLATVLTGLACFRPRVAMGLWAIFGIVSIAVRVREPREPVASGTTSSSSSARTNE
jgi:uncharacterized membrane protein